MTYPEPETIMLCPVCDAELGNGDILYYNDMGECVGCEDCVDKRFVEDVIE